MCSFVFESSLGTRAALISTAMSQVYHRLLHCSLSQLLWKQMSTLLCNGTSKSAKRNWQRRCGGTRALGLFPVSSWKEGG